jgi:hypothetical protein
VYCPNCGEGLPDDANFCLKCGALQQSASGAPSSSEDNERELRRYAVDKQATLIITNKRVIYDIKGFLGSKLEIPLRHITGVEELWGTVRIRRTDGGSAKFNFGNKGKEIAQGIRDIVAGV